LAGVAIAIVPPLEPELEPPEDAAAVVLLDELLDPHAVTTTARTTAARHQASRLCVDFI
jgi:hypothetical protein